MTKRIACVFAHPDDDTYGVAGSLELHSKDPSLDIVLVMTTSGDAGRIADPSLATRETLGAVREAEDVASWRALGLEPLIRFLRVPDGAVANVPREDLVAAYLEVLLERRPDVVVTFGPDGVTGHEDHVTVGAAATDAFHAAREQGGDGGFERLLYSSLSASRLDRVNEWLREHGREPMDPMQAFMPRGVPDATIGARVDCSAAWERKLEALRAHKTQAELEDFPYELWPEILGTEEFVLAWPERAPGGPVLSDLFDGLGDSQRSDADRESRSD